MLFAASRADAWCQAMKASLPKPCMSWFCFLRAVTFLSRRFCVDRYVRHGFDWLLAALAQSRSAKRVGGVSRRGSMSFLSPVLPVPAR